MSDFAAVLALSLAASAVSEAITYALVYRTEQFRQVKAKVQQCEAKLEDEGRSTTGNGKNKQRRIESIEAQLSTARAKASSLQLRSMLVVAVVQLGSIYLVNLMFSGVSVARLPFEPLGMFRGLIQRGLPEGSPDDACSATFVFVLGGLVFKAAIDRCFQLGLPKSSALPKWVTNPEDALGIKK
ncbi:Calcium load-activated calcium channel [Coemansia erecta]|uniref:Calcium load-activated calcium channel n=1 Tax=Coemansia asiatica TaxID=1052880 RepID=A0A9W8CHG5_9FUNG|nr:Calcium load-activated calcium channel [Coemansia asiatica]KAJ2855735.1 Calcium load-activated calcium channel [Coemansia erecta]KAJ2879945.1 Calcium load-activated calcium channel [Coemansia asiatica]